MRNREQKEKVSRTRSNSETNRTSSTKSRKMSKGAKKEKMDLPKPHNDDPEFPLYAIEQVPEHLRDNKYILAHYRAFYTHEKCVKSIFRLHNETFNIWTHLLGALYFFYLIFDLFLFKLIPEYRRGNGVNFTRNDFHQVETVNKVQGEHIKVPLLIFAVYSFGCVACMLCSAAFHTFLCHMDEPTFRFAHALDYFGITVLVVASFIPFCKYAFSCEPEWGNFYLKMICCFGVVGILGPFFRHWTSEAFTNKKILFYVCMVGSGIFPTMHLLYIPHTVATNPTIKGLLQMLFLYGFGVFIYAFKLPEVFAPGKFDVYCSSHQIWHLFVLAAALTHFHNAINMYKQYDNIQCIRN